MGRKIHVVLEMVIPEILLVYFDFEIKFEASIVFDEMGKK